MEPEVEKLVDGLRADLAYWHGRTLEARDRADAAEAQVAALRKALEPFAEAAATFRPDDADTMRPAVVQAVHYRAALAALSAPAEERSSSRDHAPTLRAALERIADRCAEDTFAGDLARAVLSAQAEESAVYPKWQPAETVPNDRPVLVDFKGAGPIVAYRDAEYPEMLVRYVGYGKSACWPTVHADYALGWMDLPETRDATPPKAEADHG